MCFVRVSPRTRPPWTVLRVSPTVVAGGDGGGSAGLGPDGSGGTGWPARRAPAGASRRCFPVATRSRGIRPAPVSTEPEWQMGTE
ncbi:hypothetical protein YT1_2422 [Rhodococcus ruber]|nr:hypothetical protein YT1_2422 [Rhodococcus ruber]